MHYIHIHYSREILGGLWCVSNLYLINTPSLTLTSLKLGNSLECSYERNPLCLELSQTVLWGPVYYEMVKESHWIWYQEQVANVSKI